MVIRVLPLHPLFWNSVIGIRKRAGFLFRTLCNILYFFPVVQLIVALSLGTFQYGAVQAQRPPTIKNGLCLSTPKGLASLWSLNIHLLGWVTLAIGGNVTYLGVSALGWLQNTTYSPSPPGAPWILLELDLPETSDGTTPSFIVKLLLWNSKLHRENSFLWPLSLKIPGKPVLNCDVAMNKGLEGVPELSSLRFAYLRKHTLIREKPVIN